MFLDVILMKNTEKSKDIQEKKTVLEKKTEPEIKEKKRTRFYRKKSFLIIAGVCGLVLIAILIFLNYKLRFVLDDELNLKIAPLSESYSVKNNEPIKINITLENNNFAQCKTWCNFSITDLRDNNLLYNKEQYLDHNTKIFKEYTLAPIGKGRGQATYLFEASCKNVKTLICQTDGKERYKSTLITVNYDLTDSEKLLINESKFRLEQFLLGMNKSRVLFEQNSQMLQLLSENVREKKILVDANKDIERKINDLVSALNDFIDLWTIEDYTGLDSKLNSQYNLNLVDVENKLAHDQGEIIRIFSLKNENVDILNVVIENKNSIMNVADFYYSHKNEKNNEQFLELVSVVDTIYEDYLILRSSISYSVDILNQELTLWNNQILRMIDDYKRMFSDGLFNNVYGEIRIAVKNNDTAINNYYTFECNDLKSIINKIEVENNNSLRYREEKYNYTLGDEKFDQILDVSRIENELAALVETKEYIKNMNISEKEYLINKTETLIYIANESLNNILGRINFSDSEYPIQIVELKKMILIDNANNILFYNENCDIQQLTNQTQEVNNGNNNISNDFGGDNNSNNNTGSNNNSNSVDNNYRLQELINKLNSINLSGREFQKVSTIVPDLVVDTPTYIEDNHPSCCTYGECVDCCIDNGCSNDSNYPVLFIHGHTMNKYNTPEYSMSVFTKIQKRMQKEGYINAGELDLSQHYTDIIKGEWGFSKRPVVLRASYYYQQYYDLGKYSITSQKSEKIENYAIRLKEIIDLIKYRTGATKVNIVSHSMGGLVVRDYLDLFGYDNVNKVILINTPNHGITGRIAQLCPVFGASKECNDMNANSIFLQNLNSKPIPSYADIYAIRSGGCLMEDNEDGDGIVTTRSAFLEGATNYVLNGSCDMRLDKTLHTDVLDPDLYPETYILIEKILKE